MGITKKLLSGSIIVFFGTIVSSVFSYVFNMLMGRMLGPVHYGDMTILLSIFTIVSVIGQTVLTIVMRYSSELYSDKKPRGIQKLLKFFTRNIALFGLIIFLVGSILVKPIASMFSLSDYLPVFITLTAVVFSLILMVNKGVLQGTQKFVAVSFVSIVEMGMRLCLGTILVKIGMMINGAMTAIAIAPLVAYLVSFLSIRDIVKPKNNENEVEYVFDKKEMLSYLWPVFITSFMLSVSLNIDIFIVKYYFSPQEAGLYSAVSTISKIILYTTTPIISVMFPMISELNIKGNKHYKIFLFSMLFTLVGALIILGLYVIMPGKIILILYGEKFVGFYNYLPEVGMIFLFYSLINLMANYYMAIKEFFFVWFYAASIIALIIAVTLSHSTLTVVIREMIVVFAIQFVLMTAYYLYQKRAQLSLLLRGEYE